MARGDTSSLISRARRGDKQAASRLMTLVIRRDAKTIRAVRRAVIRTPFIVGLNGDGGSGKTSLIVRLTQEFRQKGHKVGIINYEPPDPDSGGMYIEDRMRLSPEQLLDPDIFFRTVAVRRECDGVDKNAADLCKIFGLLGFEIVFVEPKGTAQGQTGIRKFSSVVIFTLDPMAGDEKQLSKDARLAKADIICVTKTENAPVQAERMRLKIIDELELSAAARGKAESIIPVRLVDSRSALGIEELSQEILERKK
ncbi:MAG: hypothetical protein A2667_02370 [Candidatus Wildermuthbacteria bacterium RIFCSPHIGHO2_01_FULL_47_27]|nr:MAG: hypothetical protein A2667_02370 [Candidatus Wildermuthbacteria bacterium RIFCSPHIGHO2_01_FULL_47_27]